jgi:hypothetical protein
MKSQHSTDDQARVRAEGLRRVAVASVAALALVLPLAVATAQHAGAHRGNSGHSVQHGSVGRSASGSADD